MNPLRRPGWSLVVLVILLGAVFLAIRWSQGPGEDIPSPEPPLPEERVDLYYYRSSPPGLQVVTRGVSGAASTPERIQQIVRLLQQRPDTPGLRPLLPKDVSLRSVYLNGDVVYLDFTDQLLGAAEGTTGEYLLLYSVVNSVLANLDEQHRLVQFLVEGEPRKTLGSHGEESGHVATQYPLGPRWNIADTAPL